MSQKLLVNGFIKSYAGEKIFCWSWCSVSYKITWPDLPFLPERKKIEKIEKLVANLPDKKTSDKYNKFKTSIKSWISFESKILVKTIDW